jgi:hypothetical protein
MVDIFNLLSIQDRADGGPSRMYPTIRQNRGACGTCTSCAVPSIGNGFCKTAGHVHTGRVRRGLRDCGEIGSCDRGWSHLPLRGGESRRDRSTAALKIPPTSTVSIHRYDGGIFYGCLSVPQLPSARRHEELAVVVTLATGGTNQRCREAQREVTGSADRRPTLEFRSNPIQQRSVLPFAWSDKAYVCP